MISDEDESDEDDVEEREFGDDEEVVESRRSVMRVGEDEVVDRFEDRFDVQFTTLYAHLLTEKSLFRFRVCFHKCSIGQDCKSFPLKPSKEISALCKYFASVFKQIFRK